MKKKWSLLVISIFMATLWFVSCSTQKEMAKVEPVPVPPVEIPKKEPPPPPVEEKIEFSYRTIYFDFDSSEIISRNSDFLDALADFLIKNKEVSLRIAGHADERGSLDYNFSLGEARARNVKDELQRRGVSPERINIVSYGEERPATPGSSEDAYSRNRRAEFNEL